MFDNVILSWLRIQLFKLIALYFYQIFIAFPYRRNGMLVGCKYRSIEKKFWQVLQFGLKT